MIPFIYFLIIVAWAIVVIGFAIKDYPITAIGSIFLLVLGIFVLINGLAGLSNLATDTFGIVNIAIGAYVMIRGPMELYQIF